MNLGLDKNFVRISVHDSGHQERSLSWPCFGIQAVSIGSESWVLHLSTAVLFTFLPPFPAVHRVSLSWIKRNPTKYRSQQWEMVHREPRLS